MSGDPRIEVRTASTTGTPALRVLAMGLAALALTVVTVGFLLGGPVNDLALRVPGLDKILHVVAFFVLLLVAVRIARVIVPGSSPTVLTLSLLVIAAVDELAQGWQIGRDVDPADFVASACGLLLAWAWLRRGSRPRLALVCALCAAILSVAVTIDAYGNQHHLNAAVRYQRRGDLEGALRELRLAYAQGARTPGLLNELAWMEIESGVGDPAAAVTYASLALASDPGNPDIQDTYGWALYRAGRNHEALALLLQALALKRDMYCIHYHLGEVYLALGQSGKAIEHLSKQVEREDTREALLAARTLARLEEQGLR